MVFMEYMISYTIRIILYIQFYILLLTLNILNNEKFYMPLFLKHFWFQSMFSNT